MQTKNSYRLNLKLETLINSLVHSDISITAHTVLSDAGTEHLINHAVKHTHGRVGAADTDLQMALKKKAFRDG